MIDLKQWIDRRASRPLAYAVAAVLCLQAGYLVYLARDEYAVQLKRIDRVVEIASLGIQQNNRPVIEAALLMGLHNSEAAQVALCRSGSADLIYPPSSADPCAAARSSSLRWRIRRKAVGLDAYEFLFVIRWLDAFGPMLVLLTMTAALSPLMVVILIRARRRFEKEVLAPLHHSLNEDRPLEISELDELRRRNQEFNALSRRQAVSDALVELSTQVAHDIRSPLSALEAASNEFASLPEGKRALVRAAVRRIQDIANSLLARHRELPSTRTLRGSEAPGQAASEASPSPQLVSGLVGAIVSEKRLQFGARSNVDIAIGDDGLPFGSFVRVDPVEFSRVLSNLINNAVEALGERGGTIRVGATAGEQAVRISVRDNGRGIAPDVLGRLGRRGETHGKAGGSGLGLYHARTCVERWGGRLEIASEIGRGTEVAAVLPEASPPTWFAADLRLEPGVPIVILDDDPSIHQVWNGRLVGNLSTVYEVQHFTTPQELRAWVLSNPARAARAFFLLDYELAGYAETGLSLAEELKIGSRVVLVTSRHGETSVVDGCRRLGARLLPKELARSVPLIASERASSTEERWDAILIDDDPLTRMNWKMAASSAGKRFQAFATLAAFMKEASVIDRQSTIYIDAKLGGGQDGAAESLKLRRMGFEEIYLATGHPASAYAHLEHLRGVVGKSPPWPAR